MTKDPMSIPIVSIGKALRDLGIDPERAVTVIFDFQDDVVSIRRLRAHDSVRHQITEVAIDR